MNEVLVSSSVIKNSGVSFGTSGARALVSEFTPEVCAAFTHSFVESMKSDFVFRQVAIAIDNRPSSYDMAVACAMALGQLDIDVIYYGVVPTPALAYMSQEDGIPAIMVTGSHIPFDRNGLKFYRPDGEITKSDEKFMVTASVEFVSLDGMPRPVLAVSDRATTAYMDRYTSLFDTPWLAGKRIGIYEHSSAGRDIYSRIFEKLGAEVISLGRSDSFVPIDTEAVSEADREKAIAWSREYQLDALFSTDGDGDRPLLADEKGEWLRGDVLGLLAAAAMNIEALAIPVSCNTAVELSGKFDCVKRTKIGSPYVIAEMAKLAGDYKSVGGFEANGGFLLGSDVQLGGMPLKALPTRDAMLPAIMLLFAAGKKQISAMVDELPQRYTYSDRIKDFPSARSQKMLAAAKADPDGFLKDLGQNNVSIAGLDETDGLRLTLKDGRIVHLRPSGNAPELRCYAEADSYSVARDLVDNTLQNISVLSAESH